MVILDEYVDIDDLLIEYREIQKGFEFQNIMESKEKTSFNIFKRIIQWISNAISKIINLFRRKKTVDEYTPKGESDIWVEAKISFTEIERIYENLLNILKDIKDSDDQNIIDNINKAQQHLTLSMKKIREGEHKKRIIDKDRANRVKDNIKNLDNDVDDIRKLISSNYSNKTNINDLISRITGLQRLIMKEIQGMLTQMYEAYKPKEGDTMIKTDQDFIESIESLLIECDESENIYYNEGWKDVGSFKPSLVQPSIDVLKDEMRRKLGYTESVDEIQVIDITESTETISRIIDYEPPMEPMTPIQEFKYFMSEHGIDINELDDAEAVFEFFCNNKPIIQEETITESTEYNGDMKPTQAKKTLRSLSQDLMNDWEKDDKKKMSQYTANIYANIITKNLLPSWTSNYKKLKISLDSYQSFHTMEFKTPAFSQDFVSRYVYGKQTLEQLIKKSSEITIKMSPRIFHTMKDPDDAYNFFKAAVQYYDKKVESASKKLMVEVFKLGHNMKHLIANSKLSGLVAYPLTLLFSFSDVDMSKKDSFGITDEDIKTINNFVRNIVTRYAAPEKEKKQIVKDVRDLVENLRNSLMKESREVSENLRLLSYLPEAVEKLMFGGFEDMIYESSMEFIREQVDVNYKPAPEVRMIYEKTRVKKLKRIPRDIVAYITIETEAIEDANDKMMISSYCLGKIEIVEWYIELLETGSKRYIVPHDKPYLESLRTQLLACFKKIMDVKITNPNDRPIIDIRYPKGYEG